jgi:hypothetical protein
MMENYNFDTLEDGSPKSFSQVVDELMTMFNMCTPCSIPRDEFRMEARNLYDNGYCVLTMFNEDQIVFLASVVKRSVETFHELVSCDAWDGIEREEPLVLGISGGIGIPSVFHHPGLRFLRFLIHARAIHLFDYYVGTNSDVQTLANPITKKYYLQQICDRLCARFGRINSSSMRGRNGLIWECGYPMHRDQSYASRKKLWTSSILAHVFGGWLALTGSQEFGFAEGMHEKSLKTTLLPEFTQESADVASAAFRIIHVDPGQLLVFNQTMPHAIMPYNGDIPMWRLFTAFAVTSEPELVVAKDADRARQMQSIVTIKNQERPPVYAHAYARSPASLEKWCMKTFTGTFLCAKKMSVKEGRDHFLVAKEGAQFSLVDGMCPYAPYNSTENRIYKPSPRTALGHVIE